LKSFDFKILLIVQIIIGTPLSKTRCFGFFDLPNLSPEPDAKIIAELFIFIF